MIDLAWRQEARLADGQTVTLRLVRPTDKPLLEEAFSHLSVTSRYLRFFSTKVHLTPAELRYLTEVDGVDHLALGALVARDGVDHGLGIARFIRLRERPNTAEAAIVVADEVQGKGLGRLLLAQISDAARERGIGRFRCELLAVNEKMRALLHHVAPDLEVHAEGDVIVYEFPLRAARGDG